MSNNLDIGKQGEEIACRFIIKKGYEIIERNHRERSDEIDIIAKSAEGLLIFIEVKTLASEFVDPLRKLIPEDNLTSDKLRKLKRASQIFVGKYPHLVHPVLGWQIDLIALSINREGDVFSVNHYENI